MRTESPVARCHPWRLRPACAPRSILMCAVVVSALMAIGVEAQESPRGAVEQFVGTLVRETTAAGPLASPAEPDPETRADKECHDDR